MGEKLADVDNQIVELISKNAYLIIPKIAELVGKAEPTVYRHIDKFVKAKMIERIGSRKNGYWKVKY